MVYSMMHRIDVLLSSVLRVPARSEMLVAIQSKLLDVEIGPKDTPT